MQKRIHLLLGRRQEQAFDIQICEMIQQEIPQSEWEVNNEQNLYGWKQL